MANRRIVYSGNKQITAMGMQTNSNFIWMGFAKNSEDVCILEKQFAYQPSQSFYSIEKEVEAITHIVCDASQVYVAYDDDTLLGEVFNVNNPLTLTTEINIPVGATEAPIDVQVNDSDLWFLLPGSSSGTNTKLIHCDTDGNYLETIELDNSGMEVNNASSMAIDDNGDIWIVTNTDPATLVRVFALSGGGWDYQITEIV